MLRDEKCNTALKAIQDLLIYGRYLAHQGKESSFFFEYFDALEILPWLIFDEKDNTSFFETLLLSICEEYDCMRIWNNYNET